MSPRRPTLMWARRWRAYACDWDPRSLGTRTTRSSWSPGETSSPWSGSGAPLKRVTTGHRGRLRTQRCTAGQWRTRAVETCSALSCACAESSGACRTCHSRVLCSSKACHWCARESASSGRCYLQIFCHSRQTHT